MLLDQINARYILLLTYRNACVILEYLNDLTIQVWNTAMTRDEFISFEMNSEMPAMERETISVVDI